MEQSSGATVVAFAVAVAVGHFALATAKDVWGKPAVVTLSIRQTASAHRQPCQYEQEAGQEKPLS
jgi:hypothetical protein